MSIRLLAAALLTAAFCAPAGAQGFYVERSGTKLLAPFKKVVAKANESTVRVRCDDRDAALGTVVTAAGHVLTKASELRGKVTCRLSDGTEYDATLVSVHKETDLALLKIDAEGLKPVTFADSKPVPVGHWLAAAGPYTDPVAVGIVSVATRDLGPREFVPAHNSNRGYLGVMLDMSAKASAGGAKITGMMKGSSAAKAGVKVDDLITAVDGRDVSGGTTLREILDEYRPGDTVTLKVLRGEEGMKLKVKLTPPGEQTREEVQNSMGGELSGRRTGFKTVLQSDMVIAPKDCGGPVVDLDGKVLGLGIARAGRVETWVLPAETIRPLLADMKAGKFAPVSASK